MCPNVVIATKTNGGNRTADARRQLALRLSYFPCQVYRNRAGGVEQQYQWSVIKRVDHEPASISAQKRAKSSIGVVLLRLHRRFNCR